MDRRKIRYGFSSAELAAGAQTSSSSSQSSLEDDDNDADNLLEEEGDEEMHDHSDSHNRHHQFLAEEEILNKDAGGGRGGKRAKASSAFTKASSSSRGSGSAEPRQPMSFYDAGMDDRDERWVAQKFMGGLEHMGSGDSKLLRLACPGCFQMVTFTATAQLRPTRQQQQFLSFQQAQEQPPQHLRQHTSRAPLPPRFASTRAVNCTVRRDAVFANDAGELVNEVTCACCSAPVGYTLAALTTSSPSVFIFTSVISSPEC